MPDGTHTATPAIDDLTRLTGDEREALDTGYVSIPAAPVIQAIDTKRIAQLVSTALCHVEIVDSLISVCGRALREQDCDVDCDVANVIEEAAWGRLNKARQALDELLYKCGLAGEVSNG